MMESQRVRRQAPKLQLAEPKVVTPPHIHVETSLVDTLLKIHQPVTNKPQSQLSFVILAMGDDA